MKLTLSLITALFLTLAQFGQAALSVVDISSIQVQLANARSALAEQVLHGARQIEQIRHVVRQIEQIDSYLERFGDPENVTLSTFNEAVGFLNELNLSKSSEEIVKEIQGKEVFNAPASSPHKSISPEIIFDGKAVATHDTEIFTPEIAARRSLTHYREVRSFALEQRGRIKKEIEATLQQLRNASTASEVDKINTLLQSLNAQLAANDREIQFASSEVLTRFIENQVEADIQAKARVQRERASLKNGTEQDLNIFRLPSKPLYFER